MEEETAAACCHLWSESNIDLVQTTSNCTFVLRPERSIHTPSNRSTVRMIWHLLFIIRTKMRKTLFIYWYCRCLIYTVQWIEQVQHHKNSSSYPLPFTFYSMCLDGESHWNYSLKNTVYIFSADVFASTFKTSCFDYVNKNVDKISTKKVAFSQITTIVEISTAFLLTIKTRCFERALKHRVV